MSKLTPLVIQEFLQRCLEKGRRDRKRSRQGRLAPGSVCWIFRVLSIALNQAVKWRVIPSNPARGVRLPTSVRPKPPILLSPEEVNRLLDGLRDHYLFLPTYLAVHTGMRLGEILALTWDDVDLERGVITVRRTLPQQLKAENYRFKEPKTAYSRRAIPISGAVSQTLREAQVVQEAQKIIAGEAWQDYNLVCCRGDGNPLHPPTISSAFPRLAKKLGFEGLTFHALRDTHAGLLLQAGVPLKVISANLGHSSGAVTMDRYLGLSVEFQRAASERLEEVLTEARKKS